jgi:hypothetical protein
MVQIAYGKGERMKTSTNMRRLGGWAGMLGSAIFVLVFTIEGWLRPGYNPLSMHISALSLGQRGWIQITNFICLGLLLALFTWGVASEIKTGRASRWGVILLAVLSALFIISGPFVMDPAGTPQSEATLHGTIHGLAGGFVFLLMPVTMFVFLRRFRIDPAWRFIYRWTFFLGVIEAAAVLIFTILSKAPGLGNNVSGWIGLIQRAALIPFMIWVFIISFKLMQKNSKHIKTIPQTKNGRNTSYKTPIIFYKDEYTDESAKNLLDDIIKIATATIDRVIDAFRGEWENNPSTGIRAVFGSWFISATRHLKAIICLCEKNDLSIVANVHQRQIFELFLQVRYYASLDVDTKERLFHKMLAIGCIEYLEKLHSLRNNEQMRAAYSEMFNRVLGFDKDLISEIKQERKRRQYNWFGCTYSKLAKNISRDGQDLESAYQVISGDMHGSWNLALDVSNPEPGVLDIRGYPDNRTLYLRAAEMLDQATDIYINIWNETADSVGARRVSKV